MFDQYFIWLRNVDAILMRDYGIKTHQAWQGGWSFGWHQSWVTGCQPHQAVENAIAELRDRGILDEVMAEVND